MNTYPHASKCTTNETKQTNAASKLRRLKIEENIFLQALKKLDQKNNYEVSESYTINVEFKNTTKNLLDSYTKIKTLFDDIKIITNSQELLADVEMDEIKNKVLELETIMSSFKLHLDTELNSLRSDEAILIKELEEIHHRTLSKKQPKASSASLKQAVPSPVRLLMTSPLKCSDVQEFQDFMENSPNRYGGWNEYHHNIFVTLWKKYFGKAHHDNFTIPESEDSIAIDHFMEECLSKLQGIDRNNLISHVEWYKKYLFLKSKQQIAIDKWKLNRRSMRKVPDTKQNSTQTDSNPRKKICELKKDADESIKPARKVISSDDIERLMKPTKQWLSRCNEDNQNMDQLFDIENLEKLGIPNWRQHIIS